MSQGLDLVKETSLAALEVATEQLIKAETKIIVDLVIDAICKAIPGPFDDAVLQPAKPMAESLVEKKLLELAQKISPKG